MERKGVGKARSSRGGKRAARVELTERGGGWWRRLWCPGGGAAPVVGGDL
jgi:hypothetical protein